MPGSEAFAIPDAIEPVVGWRAWALGTSADGGPELRPIIYSGEMWPARERALAACPPHRSLGHRAPEPDCSCGLYAVDALERLPAVAGRDVTVIGSVTLWGTIVEHDSGFRAELAYPSTLRLVCGPCWGSGVFSPGVVGVTSTSRGTLLAVCERHARGTDGSDPTLLERRLLASYAVDLMTDASIDAVSAAWQHPERRPRHRWMTIRSAAMAVVFFGSLLGLFALAVALR